MAAGDIYISNNASDTSAVPNAGTNLDAIFSAEQVNLGNIVSRTNENFQLDIGKYLIMYSEFFTTTNTNNNERIEIQGEIHVSGTGAVGGRGAGFIRKSSGHQSTAVRGQTILDVTSDNTDVFIRFYRTDNSTSGTVNRVIDNGGVFILQLDDTDNYAQYSNSGTQTTSGSTELEVTYNTNDEQDTGFSRSGSNVTISNAGRYLMLYEFDASQAGTGREDVNGYLKRNGTEETGTTSHYYSRGSDGTQDGACNWMGIVDVAANDVFDVSVVVPTSATFTIADAQFKIWRLPSGADTIITEATNGNYNLNGAVFAMDTVPHIDTASFTHTAGTSNIAVDQDDYVLAMGSLAHRTLAGVTRASMKMKLRIEGVTQNNAISEGYSRNSGGAGRMSLNTKGIYLVNANDDIEIWMERNSTASGTVNNDSGQFSLLSLGSIFGAYTFPPVITAMGDNVISPGETNVVTTGSRFGATQGTGKVEISPNSDYSGTIVTQTIDSWSDTSIQFDPVLTGISDGINYLYVTTDSGDRSASFQIFVGDQPYDEAVELLSPDHYWKLQNNYNDDGNSANNRPMITDVVGGGVFVTSPLLSRDDTHSWHCNGPTVRRGCADVNDMNTSALQARTMGGWIQLGADIQKSFSCIYKEGGGVNNLAFILGAGNVLTAQLADTADDNVQAFSDFKLTPNRPYHIIFRFDYNETTPEFRLYVDGIEQQVTDGNPLLATDLDSHSGDINWGDPDTSLETGGTDISYIGQDETYYAHWVTWSSSLNKSTEINDVLFKKGMPPDVIIAADTQANMQTDLDTYADTERRDWPLAIAISAPSGGGDLELTLDNITFDERCTFEIEWRGTGELTLVKSNGANINPAKVHTSNGGTVVIAEDVPITVTVQDIDDDSLLENARVYLEADTGGPLTAGTLITSTLTNVSGVASDSLRFSSNQPVTGWVRSASGTTKYQQTPISATITAEGFTTTILLIKDQ